MGCAEITNERTSMGCIQLIKERTGYKNIRHLAIKFSMFEKTDMVVVLREGSYEFKEKKQWDENPSGDIKEFIFLIP